MTDTPNSSILTRRRPQGRRRGVALSVELVMVLPVLFAVLVGTVEFGILLMSSQGVSAAANIGAREAALPSSDLASVTAAVHTALEGYIWDNPPVPGVVEVRVLVNGTLDTGTLLANAAAGDIVTVIVDCPMDSAAPDALSIFGISLAGRELTSTFVTRRE